MIRSVIGDGKLFDMDVKYTFDGESPLGTGGAVRRALRYAGWAILRVVW